MIRAATPADAEAVAAIWNPIIRDTAITFWPTERSPSDLAEMIAQRQAQGFAFLVSAEGGGVTGFAATSQFRAGGGYARSLEHTVHVAFGQRGKGIGRALMDGVASHAEAVGARLLIGAITASNLPSLAFHQRLGFSEWGRIPEAGWKFGRYHDLVLMGRLLPAG